MDRPGVFLETLAVDHIGFTELLSTMATRYQKNDKGRPAKERLKAPTVTDVNQRGVVKRKVPTHFYRFHREAKTQPTFEFDFRSL